MTGKLIGFDPLVRKEFYGLSRHWWTYLARAFFLGVMAVVLLVAWNSFTYSDVLSYSAYSRMGRELFCVFGGLQFGLIAFLALVSTCDLISREVRGKTLGILAITPLSPWGIVFGKWKSRMGVLTMMALSGIPILAVGIYMGGTGWGMLLAVALLTISMMMACAALGILCSSFMRLPFFGVIVALAVIGASLALSAIAADGDEKELAWVNPIFSLAFLLDRPSTIESGAWVGSSTLALGATCFFLWLASLRVEVLFKAEPGPSLLKRGFVALDVIFERSPLGKMIWAERTGIWESNPFLWKEMRFRLAGKLRYQIRVILALCVVIALALMIFSADQYVFRMIPMFSYVILMSLLYLACAAVGAGTFTREKEERKWDVLMTTPLRSGTVMWSKYVGAWVGVMPLALVTLLAGILSVLFRSTPFVGFVQVFLTTFVFANFTVMAGLFASNLCRTMLWSFILTMLILLFCLIGIPLVMALFAGFSRSFDFAETVIKLTNPYYYLEILAYDHSRSYAYYYSSRVDRDVSYAVAQMILYGMATGVLFVIAFARLSLQMNPSAYRHWPEEAA